MRGMNKDVDRPTSREFLKAVGIEHLNDAELQLFREPNPDKQAISSAIVHIAECLLCCSLAHVLTAKEISDALAETPYGKPDYIEQTVTYYLETRHAIDRRDSNE
mgnify:CR=1 FL=1